METVQHQPPAKPTMIRRAGLTFIGVGTVFYFTTSLVSLMHIVAWMLHGHWTANDEANSQVPGLMYICVGLLILIYDKIQSLPQTEKA